MTFALHWALESNFSVLRQGCAVRAGRTRVWERLKPGRGVCRSVRLAERRAVASASASVAAESSTDATVPASAIGSDRPAAVPLKSALSFWHTRHRISSFASYLRLHIGFYKGANCFNRCGKGCAEAGQDSCLPEWPSYGLQWSH